jgi:chromosome segregation ATPase
LVEQLVAFVLGFTICGLIGLAFLPLVSARARRLTLKRIEDRLPMTFDEIEADRDLLRARFAVEKRDLEIAIERERASRAADGAELGRRATEIVRNEDQIRATTELLNARNHELARALEHGEKVQAELSEVKAALAGREEELRRNGTEFDALAQAHRALTIEFEQMRLRLQEAEGRNERFEARRERLVAKIDAERKRVEEAEAQAKALRQGLDQGGGVAMAGLREAILDIGRQVAARDLV